MKLLIISDIHEQWYKFSPKKIKDSLTLIDYPEAILIAGDITNLGIEGINQLVKDTMLNWLEDLRDTFNCPLYWIPGNHDIGCNNLYATNLNKSKSCIFNCLNQKMSLPGFKLNIVGMSMSTCYDMPDLVNTWCNMTAKKETEKAYYEQFYDLVDKNTIILSHCPPLGILDSTDRGQHIGSQELRKLIDTKSPLVVVCGHVHNCGGEKEIFKNTVVYNTANCWSIVEV
jgi:Icc-related predicted phosphoesterase